MVVAAYGLILPPAVLEAARFGAINIHASLLPRWRGAAPIQRALLAGDAQTGVSIMQMDAGLDTGAVFCRQAITISEDDDAGTLHERLAELGAELMLSVLTDVEAGRARALPQGDGGATYANKIDKAETQLRWTRPAGELERAVRAFRPSPGAVARRGSEALKVWRARAVDGLGDPGTVLSKDGSLVVACGTGALAIDEVQPAGGRRMSVAEFLRGRSLPAGERFD
jgi:methionyl-tRNA formyltransferase